MTLDTRHVSWPDSPQDRGQPVVVILEQRGDFTAGVDEVSPLLVAGGAGARGRTDDGGQQLVAGDLVGEQQRAEEITRLGEARQLIVGALVDTVVDGGRLWREVLVDRAAGDEPDDNSREL